MLKIWLIASKDVRETFRDRNLLLIMFAAPLALATIIALAFSGLGGGAAPIGDIPMAVVNLDEGSENGNMGAIYTQVFVESGEPSLVTAETPCPLPAAGAGTANPIFDLTNAVALTETAAARACVDDGTYVAAVIIPADFSTRISYSPTQQEIQSVSVEVYFNPSSPIAASVVRSITESITNQMATGSITVAAVIETLMDINPLQALQLNGSETFAAGIEQAYNGSTVPISIERQTVAGEPVTFNPLVVIGASQAIFFALFTANGGATAVIEERRNWTLQRMLITPTARSTVLLGKLTGVFVMILVQLLLLFIAFSIVASVIAGEVQFIWGTNIPGIVLILFTSALAACGLGSIVAAAARTPEQANTIGSVLAIAMAAFGGAFGFSLSNTVPSLGWISQLSLIYWGTDAFALLAQGDPNILTHALVLTVFGVVTFFGGLVLFTRRLEDR